MTSPFPPLPTSSVTLPDTPLTRSALAYTQQHTYPSTVNHCLRSSAFALLIARKLSLPIAAETIVLSILLHDLGWATTRSLISKDKRFEVDGADLAKAFLASEDEGKELNLTQIWTAIALHTSPSISLNHPDCNIAATSYGIGADFSGPNMPGGLIGVDEYKEIVRAFPRIGFAGDMREIMCNLCREKAETTYNNFVGQFGERYLKGEEGERFRKGLEGSNLVDRLEMGLKACEEYE